MRKLVLKMTNRKTTFSRAKVRAAVKEAFGGLRSEPIMLRPSKPAAKGKTVKKKI